MMERSLYKYVLEQLLEDLVKDLPEADDVNGEEFARRMDSFLKISYELNTDDCIVEIFSAMEHIRAALTEDQLKKLTDVITTDGDIQLIRITLLGQPLFETGRFANCPVEKAREFNDLDQAILKGVVKGIIETCRANDLTVIESMQGRHDGIVSVSDQFKYLIDEVLEDEIEDAVSEFRQSLMAEVTAASFVDPASTWAPPTGNPARPPGGGES